MKKTILLGVLALFAINVITIQTATAQIGEGKPKAKEEHKFKPKESKQNKPTNASNDNAEPVMAMPDQPTNSSNDNGQSGNYNIQSSARSRTNDAALQAQVEQQLAEKTPAERQNLWRSLTNKSKRFNASLTDRERIMLQLLNKEFKK